MGIIMRHRIISCFALTLLLFGYTGCGDHSQEAATSSEDSDTAAADTQTLQPELNKEAETGDESKPTENALNTNPKAAAEAGESQVTIKPLDQKAFNDLAVHTFPDGTHFRYPKDFLIGGRGAEVGVHSHTSTQFAYIMQLPADGETDPTEDWILERHDKLVTKENLFKNGFDRGPIEIATSPTASFARFTCKLVQPDGVYYTSKHAISIINDRV